MAHSETIKKGGEFLPLSLARPFALTGMHRSP